MEGRNDDVIAEGEQVASCGTFRNIHKGEFLGVSETTYSDHAYLDRDTPHQGSKIVECWGAFDTLGFMIQIGAVPPP